VTSAVRPVLTAEQRLDRVRKYVLSSLVCSVVMLHSLAVAALGSISPDKGGSRVGLFVLSVLFGCVAIGAVRLINRKRLLTPWFLCAFIIPTGFYLLWLRVLGN